MIRSKFYVKLFIGQIKTKAGLHCSMASSFKNRANEVFDSHSQYFLPVIRNYVPRLEPSNHKGVCGRIGIIGGCKEYTGAPYFAAISALRLGADLVHVFCAKDAAAIIKGYNPELIVHPILDDPDAIKEINQWLPRMHSLVVGPGLGRDPRLLKHVAAVLSSAREKQIPLTLDADAVFLASQHPELVSNYKKAILTPNAAEFNRLFNSVTSQNVDIEDTNTDESIVKDIALRMGGVTIVRKGREDVISNGTEIVKCSAEGSCRRCGGQGDLLAGTMGVFSYWAHRSTQQAEDRKDVVDKFGPCISAAYAACLLTRCCNKEAFSKMHRATVTSDMINALPAVFADLFD